MSRSDAAARAAFSNPRSEVRMALVSSVVRAPESNFSEITIKRDGEPDLVLGSGRLLLTVETSPRGSSPAHPNKRWKLYRLYGTEPLGGMYGNREPYRQLVVAEEGHSSLEGETVRYYAYVCESAVKAWDAMGKLDELKQPFADLGLRVVERI